MFPGKLGFDTAPGFAVFRNHDLARNIDAVALEHLVVFRNSIIHEDELGGHITVGGKGVIRWQNGVALGGTCVPVDDVFFEQGLVGGGRKQFERALQRYR